MAPMVISTFFDPFPPCSPRLSTRLPFRSVDSQRTLPLRVVQLQTHILTPTRGNPQRILHQPRALLTMWKGESEIGQQWYGWGRGELGGVCEARTMFLVKVSIGVFLIKKQFVDVAAGPLTHIFKGCELLYYSTACRNHGQKRVTSLFTSLGRRFRTFLTEVYSTLFNSWNFESLANAMPRSPRAINITTWRWRWTGDMSLFIRWFNPVFKKLGWNPGNYDGGS